MWRRKEPRNKRRRHLWITLRSFCVFLSLSILICKLQIVKFLWKKNLFFVIPFVNVSWFLLSTELPEERKQVKVRLVSGSMQILFTMLQFFFFSIVNCCNSTNSFPKLNYYLIFSFILFIYLFYFGNAFWNFGIFSFGYFYNVHLWNSVDRFRIHKLLLPITNKQNSIQLFKPSSSFSTRKRGMWTNLVTSHFVLLPVVPHHFQHFIHTQWRRWGQLLLLPLATDHSHPISFY